MAAVGCRVATIVMKPIAADGSVIDKKSATIAQMTHSTSEMRVMQDTVNAPNSTGFPSITDYIKLEALDGYKVAIINQSWIITYNG